MSVNSLNTFLNIRDSHLRVVSGNVHATAMNIGGINVDVAHGLQSVTNQGNVTSNTLQFSNATTAFVTTANVTVGRDLTVTGNALVSSNLTVTGNVTVSDDLTVTENLFVSNNLTVTGNLNVATIMSDSNVVAEYTGPHDRPLRKYPEVALTADAETASGYKGYKVEKSSAYTVGTYPAWEAFNGIFLPGNDGGTEGWISGQSPATYSTSATNGEYLATSQDTFSGAPSGQQNGSWIKIQLPKKIKLDHVMLKQRSGGGGQEYSKSVVIYASINDSTWQSLGSFDASVSETVTFNTNSTTYYDYFVLHIRSINNTNFVAALEELEYYGHEEGDSSLDTTLKSVYNVPGTQQLEVYYDAKDLVDGAVTSVTDLSGNGVTGAGSGDLAVSNGAFTFDGTGDEISGTLPSSANGDWVHSLSMWFKADSVNSANDGNTLFYNTGSISANNILFLRMYGGTNPYIGYSDIGSEIKTFMNILTGVWYHLTLTYSGGGWANAKMYINGELTNDVTSTDTTPLTLTGSSTFYIGRAINGFNPSFNGSIANFRLFSKALNADQIKELYDYQKDYFLGTRSSVTLYKGHLGIGVAEPSGQLELAGDERIQEYPPRDLTGFETMIEGEGTYKVSSSGDVTNPDLGDGTTSGTTTDHPAIAFTANNTFFRGVNGTYNTSSVPASYTGTHFTNGVGGDFLQIELPHKINLKSINITSRTSLSIYYDRGPHTGFIFGSNDGGTTWSQVASWTGLNWTLGESKPIQINSNTLYSTYRLVASELQNTVGAHAIRFNIDRWQLFGTPGPTTLDKGSLSLTRSLDVPRISRYDVDTETPRPEKLVVDFDTTVNSSPTDISGQGNHGTLVGATYSAADKAFSFDGGDYILGSLTNSGSFTNTVSLWFKMDEQQSTLGSVSTIGNRRTIFEYGPNRNTALQYAVVDIRSAYMSIYMGDDRQLPISVFSPQQNQWHHLVVTYSGSGTIRVFVDNVEYTSSLTVTANNTLALPTNTQLLIGSESRLNSAKFRGDISNFKVYNVALEASEVQKLYRLGRTGRSMVISDTAVGIGKVPEAQLDVRGNLNVDGVITSNIPAFSAYEYDGYTATATGYVTLGNTFVNKGGCYDTSNGTFTAPISGTYRFTVDATIRTYSGIGNGSGSTTITLHINNANWNPTNTTRPLIYQVIDPGTNHQHVSGSLVWNLNAGDTVRIYDLVIASNTDINWGNGYGRFMGYLIS